MDTKFKSIIRFKSLFILTTIVALICIAYFSGFDLTILTLVATFIMLFGWYIPDAERRAYKHGQEDMAHSLGKVKNPLYKDK